MNKINVVGLGYIGLPTALMLAAHDIEVIGTDYNEKLVQTLKEGHTTFTEDGLEELFQKALMKGITFSTEYACTDIYIVADVYKRQMQYCSIPRSNRRYLYIKKTT